MAAGWSRSLDATVLTSAAPPSRFLSLQQGYQNNWSSHIPALLFTHCWLQRKICGRKWVERNKKEQRKRGKKEGGTHQLEREWRPFSQRENAKSDTCCRGNSRRSDLQTENKTNNNKKISQLLLWKEVLFVNKFLKTKQICLSSRICEHECDGLWLLEVLSTVLSRDHFF